MIDRDPTGWAATVGATIKIVLMSVVALGLPWLTDVRAANIALALTAILDLLLILGVIRPRTIAVKISDAKVADARAELPPGAVSAEDHAAIVNQALNEPVPPAPAPAEKPAESDNQPHPTPTPNAYNESRPGALTGVVMYDRATGEPAR
ncbi:hypothetical protein Lfu02_17770 [Longispora fulva]|uniref:Putative membrane protein n=1 Tax=Longispora fulva TaxID=619741 RepID=A0A8J7H0K4_9ACTN|nr:hypothetical protein [Longispora fulva]MBG6140218.1 putative membrane protein [Longispora fulva]GIG57405.1 hypothetical protein Lfu02_17770 [Longispora fulva]